MSMTCLERLLFVQGGNCFFCKSPLSKADASVEHLFATANGGGNNEDNCVACCKSLNAILGSMSLKDKFQVVLNQKGHFKCPSSIGTTGDATDTAMVKAKLSSLSKETAGNHVKPDNFALVVANLKSRGNAKPGTIKTLTSTIVAIFPKGITESEVAAIVRKLQSMGIVSIHESKVSYVF